MDVGGGELQPINVYTQTHVCNIYIHRKTHTRTHGLGRGQRARIGGIAEGEDVTVLLVLQCALVDVDEALFWLFCIYMCVWMCVWNVYVHMCVGGRGMYSWKCVVDVGVGREGHLFSPSPYI